MASTTTSAVLVRPRTIELRDLPIPEIGADDGLLRVEGTGICGSDWDPYANPHGLLSGRLPLILGHEIVGRVERIGAVAAARWGLAEGDRVVLEETIPCGRCRTCRTGRYRACNSLVVPGEGRFYGYTPVDEPPHLWGGFGEYVYLHPNALVHKIADSVPVDVAPLFIPIANGIEWVQRVGGAGVGATVVVQGPGQHGLGCVIGAKEAGAGSIIVLGTSRDAHRLALARQLGAHHTFDVEVDDVVARVAAITGGRMADVVVDVTDGAPGTLGQALDLVGQDGTIIAAGLKDMRPLEGFLSDKLIIKGATLRGVQGHDLLSVVPALRLVESGSYPLEALCTHTFPLDRCDEGLRTIGGEGAADALHVTILPPS